MAKPRKVNTSKAAEATLVEGAYRLLSVCTDARLADLCDRLLTASKALRAEAIETAPRKQKSLGLRPGDFPG